MKKVLFKLSSAFAAVALFVGQLTVTGACYGDFCQPKVPEKMLKK